MTKRLRKLRILQRKRLIRKARNQSPTMLTLMSDEDIERMLFWDILD